LRLFREVSLKVTKLRSPLVLPSYLNQGLVFTVYSEFSFRLSWVKSLVRLTPNFDIFLSVPDAKNFVE